MSHIAVQKKIVQIIDQLRTAFLIVGDTNARSPV